MDQQYSRIELALSTLKFKKGSKSPVGAELISNEPANEHDAEILRKVRNKHRATNPDDPALDVT